MSVVADWPAGGPVTVDPLDDGAIWHVKLATPKANILDSAKIELLTGIFRRAKEAKNLKAVLIEGAGPHFSFGASVEEHLPGKCETMIPSFHRLFDVMLDSGVVTLAAVRGQCLGGGLELAGFCNRLYAAADARFGQPEIVLGVFAPVASVFLAERIGRGAAEDLCLSGRSVAAEDAARLGLVDELSDDPGAAGLAYIRKYLLPRSASSLRLALRALRGGLAVRFRRELKALERLYLEELMQTEDAQEGLRAFLEETAARVEELVNEKTVQALVERAESICRDPRLATVRRWKEQTGGLAIGYMPIYVPRELFHAQGVLPVGILGGGEDVEIIRGDAYYQSYICHIPRSTIELGLNGSLDCLDGMIFPAICDVIRNLSGVWKLEFPDKLSRYFDVPQNFDAAIGGKFYRGELEDLSRELARRGARPYDAEALHASVELYNHQRRLVAEAYELRRQEPWKVPTSELYVLLRAGLVLPPEEFSEMFREYLDAVRATDSRAPKDQARVVLIGSFCEQPPLGLIKTLERSGCYIVDDDLVQTHRFIQGDVPVDGDPLQSLVEAFLERTVDSPTRYIDEKEKGLAAVKRVQQTAAEGVLFCAPSFCDPALLDQPMAVAAMDRAGIPWTAFKYSENSGQFQVIREQAGTFADSIKLWSEV